MKREEIIIIGAGLVGSLLGIFLSRRGHRVNLYEKRGDLRGRNVGGGRSINLAMSDRGLKALSLVGLKEKVLEMVIPMEGRMIHDEKGNEELQPYGDAGQVINSISRENLNILLLEEAEKNGVNLNFNVKCEAIDTTDSRVKVTDDKGTTKEITGDLIVGADGAFSAVRGHLQKTDRFNYNQEYLAHGYKELTIPPHNGDFAMDPNALHIWPRKSFMLIALPNLDKTFTCTLFFPFEGEPSFEKLNTENEVKAFFEEVFPDTLPLITDLENEFFRNPTSSLVTVRCSPWVKNRCLLIGDAAHAIVPFYGQGMNAGFEDCTVLDSIIEGNEGDWDLILDKFQQERKRDADAIADLALRNFIEMRDSVIDENFVLRKKIEKELHESFGDRWLPLYSMVTFSDMPYSEALRRGKIQDSIMGEVLSDCDKIDFDLVLSKYESLIS